MFDTLKKGKTEQAQAKANADTPTLPTAMVHSGVLSDLQTTNNCDDGNKKFYQDRTLTAKNRYVLEISQVQFTVARVPCKILVTTDPQ